MTDEKGIIATITTGLSAFIAWLPQVETMLRVGVSVAGIYAGIYAAHYWKLKAKLLTQKQKRKQQQDLNEEDTDV